MDILGTIKQYLLGNTSIIKGNVMTEDQKLQEKIEDGEDYCVPLIQLKTTSDCRELKLPNMYNGIFQI